MEAILVEEEQLWLRREGEIIRKIRENRGGNKLPQRVKSEEETQNITYGGVFSVRHTFSEEEARTTIHRDGLNPMGDTEYRRSGRNEAVRFRPQSPLYRC